MKQKYCLPSVSILDDDEMDQYITEKMLVKNAFTDAVQVYSNGLILLDYLALNSATPELIPDLLILDIQMPIINGFEFLKQLALLPNVVVSKLKVVLLSNNLRCSLIDDLIKNKVILAFYNKPLTTNNLEEIAANLTKGYSKY
jgi:CheY-like chemotaxis protein